MKENKAFRIPFITKKQLKSRQALKTARVLESTRTFPLNNVSQWDENNENLKAEVLILQAIFSHA